MNNSAASSHTSHIISFGVQGGNKRNRGRKRERKRKGGVKEGEKGEQQSAHWRIIPVRGGLNRLLPRVSSLVIDVSPSRFAHPVPFYACGYYNVDSDTPEIRRSEASERDPARIRECIIYECIRRNSIRRGIKSAGFPPISLTSISLSLFPSSSSLFLMHFENFALEWRRCANERAPSRKMQSAFIANNRLLKCHCFKSRISAMHKRFIRFFYSHLIILILAF